MMIRTLVFAAVLAAPSLAAATPTASPLSDGDAAILAHAHAVNTMEIDLGKLAQAKGSKAVKSYAQQLVKDHQGADKDAMALAKKHGLAKLPADEPKTDTDRDQKKMMDDQMTHLKSLSGTAFDDEYLRMMVDGHDKELAKVDASLTTAVDPDLITYLRAVKPVMQHHEDDAKALQHSATAPKS